MAKTKGKKYSQQSNDVSYTVSEKTNWFTQDQLPMIESGWEQTESLEDFNNYLEEYD